MDVINIKAIIIIFMSSTIFTLLLNQIYNNKPEVFSFINKIPEGWKGKWLIKFIVLLFLMTIVSVFVVIIGLNETIGTIIIGFIISLTELIFKKPGKRN